MNMQTMLGSEFFIAWKQVLSRRRVRAAAMILMAGIFLAEEGALPVRAQEAQAGRVVGTVLAEDTGKPIAGAWVRVSSPGTDMRSVREVRAEIHDGMTDAKGRFEILTPRNDTISLNAFAAGYEEAAGLWMSMNQDFHKVAFPTNKQEFTLKLKPARYVAGIVTDEDGRPLAGAAVEATLRDERTMGYLAFDTTGTNGRFEVFDFPASPETLDGNPKGRGALTFRNPTKLTSSIENVYALSETERTNLHIRLSLGHAISGRVISTDGKPAAKIAVEALPGDESAAQRAGVTDADGRFVIRALPDGKVTIRAHSATFDERAVKTIQLNGADAEVNFQFERVALKNPPKVVSLLGMKLADMSPELQEVYGQDEATGVVVLDPGMEHWRLGIGELSQGERFWIVGEKRVNTIRELVAEILRIEAIAPPGAPNEGCRGNVRVVYAYRNRAGTNTQRVKLTDEDVAELMGFKE